MTFAESEEADRILSPLKVAPISRVTLALFAGASGDHNPMHVDLDAAKSVGLPDVFAHGMLSMAYLGRLLTAWAPQRQIRSFHVRYVAITPVHGEPVCTGRVTRIDDADGERRATVELAARLADGTITLTGDAVVAI